MDSSMNTFQERQTAAESIDAVPPSVVPTPRVLLVDDSREVLLILRRIMRSEKYEILEATDGDEALRKARENLPDLMLLDVLLPGIDGLEVCRQLKEDPATANIRIVLVTSCTTVDERVKGFEAGAEDYATKPFHVPELRARTRTILRLKQVTDDLERRNRQLLKSQNDLIRAEKMATIGLLASGIAHEFNNIMGGIAAYAQLARTDARHQETLVDVALTQTERALELTRSLSTYNRSSNSAGFCDAGTAIEGALCLAMKEIEKQSVHISTELEGEIPVAIGPGQLQEVVLNLVLNAIHAVDSVDGAVRIRVETRPKDGNAVIEVIDNGIGISKENVQRIFDPFFTTKGALGGGNEQGTGLGLTVCYNIVNSHKGTLEVKSESGKGSTFRITLPLRSSEEVAAIAAVAQPPQEEPIAEERLRILVLDDEETARDSLSEFLHEHDVVCCSRVEAALEANAIQRFDFVILDVCMPGSINGFAAFDRFQRFEEPPRIIFSSGRIPDKVFDRYIDRAHGHLLKPFKFEDLATLLGIPTEMCVS